MGDYEDDRKGEGRSKWVAKIFEVFKKKPVYEFKGRELSKWVKEINLFCLERPYKKALLLLL